MGALGSFELESGCYAYVGSAHGPGGLAARIGHHRRRARSPHWHVDYLRHHTALREVWFAQGKATWEHLWAAALEDSPGASVPMPGFGASDCSCTSHLIHLAGMPRVPQLRRRLAAASTPVASASGPAVRRWVADRQGGAASRA